VIPVLIALALGLGLAFYGYAGLPRTRGSLLGPLIARGIAWSALLLLLFNLALARPAASRRPIVLLDASLSMDAAGGHWRAALDSATRTGDVRRFGDDHASDSTAFFGRSRLMPALVAAAASDRPVTVMTDGELDDGATLPADLRRRATFRLFPRDSVPDYALTMVDAPARVTAGDTIPLQFEVASIAGAAEGDLRVRVRAGGRMLDSISVHVSRSGATRAHLALPSRGLAPGQQLLAVELEHRDPEPRTDTRLVMVDIAATPGVVLIAAPGDWDARALFRALQDVAGLPVRGYVELARGQYRGMHDLRPATTGAVAAAARGADLLVLKGDAGSSARGGRARGEWRWPSGTSGPTPTPGDWYLSSPPGTPVSGAFLGLPVDSFAPATAAVPLDVPVGGWVALEARNRRRGAPWPVVAGWQAGGRREVVVGVDGLWRWAFRGGTSEQAYRNWVAATVSWLLAAPDSVAGVARLVEPVVARGRPLVFEWAGAGPPTDVPIGWTADSASGTDTLRFGASGRAELWLPPGDYRWRLAGGGVGRAAVEAWSPEWLPGRPTVENQMALAPVPDGQTTTRDRPWLFGVVVMALAFEWWARRRLGLR
jgi:hypothetical protein